MFLRLCMFMTSEREAALRKRLEEIAAEQASIYETLKEIAPDEGDVRWNERLNSWTRFTREGWKVI